MGPDTTSFLYLPTCKQEATVLERSAEIFAGVGG